MNRKFSPKSVNLTAYWGVNGAVYESMYETVNKNVWRAMDGAVYESVNEVGYEAVWRASRGVSHFTSPHPNLERFAGELRQLRGGAP